MAAGCSPQLSATVYSSGFYAGLVDGSASSAAVVVPLVLSLLPVRSVVDVGCGVGPWAAEFLVNGVLDVWGINGEYVDRSQLRIPPDRLSARDLTKPLQFHRTFELAVCLEVAGHLPESRASGGELALTPCQWRKRPPQRESATAARLGEGDWRYTGRGGDSAKWNFRIGVRCGPHWLAWRRLYLWKVRPEPLFTGCAG